MSKKIFAFIFLFTLLVAGFISFNDIYKKYTANEIITAQIYHIDKQAIEYKVNNPAKNQTRAGYIYTVYYSFEFNNENKIDSFEGNNFFYRIGQTLPIKYDEKTNTSEPFIPITFLYIIIINIIYLMCYVLCLIKKIGTNTLYEEANPPLLVQLFIIAISCFVWRGNGSGEYLLSFFFMATSIGIAIKMFISLIKKPKQKN